MEIDPQTLPRRKRNRDHRPLTPDELSFQDRLKAGRDTLAARLEIEPTLIANRAQLAQIAKTPEQLDDLLLPWQAEIIREIPAFIKAIKDN